MDINLKIGASYTKHVDSKRKKRYPVLICIYLLYKNHIYNFLKTESICNNIWNLKKKSTKSLQYTIKIHYVLIIIYLMYQLHVKNHLYFKHKWKKFMQTWNIQSLCTILCIKYMRFFPNIISLHYCWTSHKRTSKAKWLSFYD